VLVQLELLAKKPQDFVNQRRHSSAAVRKQQQQNAKSGLPSVAVL